MHGCVATNTSTADLHHDAPSMKREKPDATMPALSSVLMPTEIEEIRLQSAVDSKARTMSKKNLKRLARALIPELKTPEPISATPAASAHREKTAEVGNQLDPLIAWYSLVAKPIPRKLWSSMPKAQAAVDAE